jgi:Ca-activated chloride channel family protein
MKRSALTAAGLLPALLLIFLPAFPQARRLAPQKQDDRRIKVDVSLVNVFASVLDNSGRPVPDLPREAFEVYEEGVKQQVEVFESETQQPLDLALLIDSSLSTLTDLAFEKEAAARFIRQVVRPGDRLAVFEVSDVVSQLAEFTSNVGHLEESVRRIEGGGSAPLYDAIVLGSQALEKRPLGRRRVLVLVTDGGETNSRAKFEEARRAALAAGTMLYTILINPIKSEGGRNTAGEHALVTITEVTGGSMYFPLAAADLNAIFDRMDRELRTQYRLGYYPTPRPPQNAVAAFRRLEVRVIPVAAEGEPSPAATVRFSVHHRLGYFTPGEM